MPRKDDFLITTTPIKHTLDTPFGDFVVFVRPMSWIQQQEALSRFVDFSSLSEDSSPRIDFGGYWRYVFQKCIARTEPELTTEELLNLNPEVGSLIQGVLPSIFDIISGFANGVSPLG